MKIGASTILHRDRPLNWTLFHEFQQAGIESLELTDYHPDFSFTDLETFTALRLAMEDLSLHLNSLHIHLEIFDDYDLATLDAAQRDKNVGCLSSGGRRYGNIRGWDPRDASYPDP